MAFASMLALGERAGLDRGTLLEAFTSGAFASPQYIGKRKKIAERDYSAEFSLALALKDGALNVALQDEVRFVLPVHREIAREFAQAVADGLGDEDLFAIGNSSLEGSAEPLDKDTGLELPVRLWRCPTICKFARKGSRIRGDELARTQDHSYALGAMNSRAGLWVRASAVLIVTLAALTGARSAAAGTLEIRDESHVLSPSDVARLRAAVRSAPFDARVALTSDFADSRELSRFVGSLLVSANMIAVGLDTQHHHVQVHFGVGAGIPQMEWGNVERAGNDSFRRGAWTDGVESIVRSAADATRMASPTPGVAPTHHWIVGPVFGLLIAAGVIGLLIYLARRSRADGNYYAGPNDSGYGPQPPWGGAGGPYGPRPGGMGAVGGGLIGAGLGGLAGYELGKMEGEREQRGLDGGSRDRRFDEGSPDENFDAGGGGSSWDDGGGGFDGGGGGPTAAAGGRTSDNRRRPESLWAGGGGPGPLRRKVKSMNASLCVRGLGALTLTVLLGGCSDVSAPANSVTALTGPDGSSTSDSGSSAPDASSSTYDASTSIGDAASSPEDADSPLRDAVASTRDAKSPPRDSSSSAPNDATSSAGDANPTAGDATSSTGDGSTSASSALVHLVGRFAPMDPTAQPTFAWPGSAIVAAFTGTGISVQLVDSAPPSATNYFTVVIDGATPTVVSTSSSTQTYTLASGLAQGQHTLTLTKRTESYVGVVQFLGFQVAGGSLVASPEPFTRRIELVGDSITCGYGDLGDGNCSFTSSTEDVTVAYGELAAAQLNAQATVIAYSGIGMWRDFAGDVVTDQMPMRFERTLADDPSSQWGFTTPNPDVVVINLGTNDFAYDDPGQSYVTAYVGFLHQVRQHYPAAQIICTSSPMLSGTDHSSEAADVQSAITQVGDPKVAFLDFVTQSDSAGYGCDGHPSLITHQAMATVLVAKIRSLMGW